MDILKGLIIIRINIDNRYSQSWQHFVVNTQSNGIFNEFELYDKERSECDAYGIHDMHIRKVVDT